MQLLTILTLIYVAILVIALAASLIAILVYLRRIAGTLGEVGSALEQVRKETAPLEAYMEQVRDATGDSADQLSQAEKKLKSADERLAELVEPASVAEGARS